MADEKPEEGWVEQVAVTGRPQDTPLPNTTFADRAKAQFKGETEKPAPKKAARK